MSVLGAQLSGRAFDCRSRGPQFKSGCPLNSFCFLFSCYKIVHVLLSQTVLLSFPQYIKHTVYVAIMIVDFLLYSCLQCLYLLLKVCLKVNCCTVLLQEYEKPKFCEETTHLQFYHKHKRRKPFNSQQVPTYVCVTFPISIGRSNLDCVQMLNHNWYVISRPHLYLCVCLHAYVPCVFSVWLCLELKTKICFGEGMYPHAHTLLCTMYTLVGWHPISCDVLQ